VEAKPAALSVATALDQAAAQLDGDFPGLPLLLRRLTSKKESDRCDITELRQHDVFRDMAMPSHWAPMRDNRLRLVRLRPGTDDDDVALRALQGALETQDPTWLGVGADATQWPPSIAAAERHLKLAAAWRVQHPGMWARYSAAVDQAFDDARRGPPLPPTRVRGSLLQAVAELPGQVHSVAVNENYLLTGLPAPTLHTVLHNGLNERFSGANAGTMFGEGSYFAEDAGKCDQYTRAADAAYKQQPALHSLHDLLYESRDEHPGDVCYVLVCRVVLGYTLRTQHSCGHGSEGRGTAMDAGATDDGTVFATRRHKEYARRFHPLLSILTEIYL
jgi:hypothetical protein